MDRFLQAQTVLHFDAGLGLFKCSEEDVNDWIAGLVDIIRLGIGKGDRHIMGAYDDVTQWVIAYFYHHSTLQFLEQPVWRKDTSKR